MRSRFLYRIPAGLVPAAIFIAALATFSVSFAAAPKFINYKATLTRPDGSPVPDSTYSMHFAIYRDETGGTELWFEDHAVSTKSGDFHVKLGSINQLADSVFADSLRYLGIKVGDDIEMAPRTVIGSVPWALNAHYAEKVMDKSIGKDQLKDKAVGTEQLDSLAVDEDRIKGKAVGRDKLKDKAVGTDQLDSLAVDEGRIQGKAVGRDKLKDKSVGRAQIDTLAVDTGRLEDDAVTSEKIADGAIQFADIGQNGASAYQVMKWSGSAWEAADDESTAGAGDSDWTISGNVLSTGGAWGISRYGNTLNGMADSTHVNLGSSSTTGEVSMSDAYITVGGGYGHTARGDFSTVSGGRENESRSPFCTVGGGDSNVADNMNATVGGGRENTAFGDFSTVCGGWSNTAGQDYGFIGGGYINSTSNNYTVICGGENNRAEGEYSFVGGGGHTNPSEGNETYGDYSFIGGGSANRTGTTSPGDGLYAVVGGGRDNRAIADYSVVFGGRENRAWDVGSAVGGGEQNAASGQFATVPGGWWNEARGDYSFAAGSRAKARHQGSIVIAASFSEMPDDSVRSGDTGQIVLRADNGMYITDSGGTAPVISGKLIDTSTGAFLSLAGDWTNVSDMNLKENFTEIDTREILERVARLPVTRWNYKADDPNVQHIGPTAQDFKRLFGIGSNDRSTSTVDPAGVALAAIKGLHEKTAELERKTAEIEGLKKRIDELSRLVEELRKEGGR
jgi:hypothetical protein